MWTWQERIAAIEAAGTARKDIAAAADMPYSTLNDVITGRTKEPKGMAAVKIFEMSEPLMAGYAQRVAGQARAA